jgi:hypothetical protein
MLTADKSTSAATKPLLTFNAQLTQGAHQNNDDGRYLLQAIGEYCLNQERCGFTA